MERERQNELFLRWRDHNDLQAADELCQAACEQIKAAKKIFADICGVYESKALSNVVEEVISGTFLEVTKNLNKFNPARSVCFTTYCVGIAKNITKRIREQNGKDHINISSLDPIDVDPQDYRAAHCELSNERPYHPLIDEENIKEIIDAICKLPEEPSKPLRTVFCLIEGWKVDEVEKGRLVPSQKKTQEEVAKKYGCSRSWAFNKYTEAKQILAKMLVKTLNEHLHWPVDQGE
ncbi:MAG: sigma-70 family RNA polymerase sigma factor [Sedimentisphaerales bacterium]|nr:sigma-70 family RNA polymerase sigma factor [Sedimentisphaerales bacterium]